MVYSQKVISDNAASVRENFNVNVKCLTHVNTESERNNIIKILVEHFSVWRILASSPNLILRQYNIIILLNLGDE